MIVCAGLTSIPLRAAPSQKWICQDQRVRDSLTVTIDLEAKRANLYGLLAVCGRPNECPHPPPQAYYLINSFPTQCRMLDASVDCASARSASHSEFSWSQDLVSGESRLAATALQDLLSVHRERELRSGVMLACRAAQSTDIRHDIQGQGLRTWDEMKRAIELEPSLTLDQFLDRLSRDFFQNSSVVMNSRGLIHATMDAPGIVMVGGFSAFSARRDGSPGNDRIFPQGPMTFLALSSGTRGPDANKLDVMEYSPRRAKLGFHQVQFKAASQPRATIKTSPARCMECHEAKTGRGERYFLGTWDLYPNWPGMVGSGGNPKVADEFYVRHSSMLRSGASRLNRIRHEVNHGWGFVSNSIIEEALSTAHELQFLKALHKEMSQLDSVKRARLAKRLAGLASEDTRFNPVLGATYKSLKDTPDFKRQAAEYLQTFRTYIRDVIMRENEIYLDLTGRRLVAENRIEEEVRKRYEGEFKDYVHPSTYFLIDYLLREEGISLPLLGLTHPLRLLAPSHPLSLQEVAFAQFLELLGKTVATMKN